jgi:hypothetical protein
MVELAEGDTRSVTGLENLRRRCRTCLDRQNDGSCREPMQEFADAARGDA